MDLLKLKVAKYHLEFDEKLFNLEKENINKLKLLVGSGYNDFIFYYINDKLDNVPEAKNILKELQELYNKCLINEKETDRRIQEVGYALQTVNSRIKVYNEQEVKEEKTNEETKSADSVDDEHFKIEEI